MLLSAASNVETLRLRVFVPQVVPYMRNLLQWPLVKFGCGHGVRQQPLPSRSAFENSAFVPIAAAVLAMPRSPGPTVRINAVRAIQIASSTNDAVRATACLEQLDRL